MPVDIAALDLEAALTVSDRARAHDLSAYDAAYLALARSRGLGLATVDQRLAAACRAAGVPLVDQAPDAHQVNARRRIWPIQRLMRTWWHE